MGTNRRSQRALRDLARAVIGEWLRSFMEMLLSSAGCFLLCEVLAQAHQSLEAKSRVWPPHLNHPRSGVIVMPGGEPHRKPIRRRAMMHAHPNIGRQTEVCCSRAHQTQGEQRGAAVCGRPFADVNQAVVGYTWHTRGANAVQPIQ